MPRLLFPAALACLMLSLAACAQKLRISEGNARVALRRLRQRFGELLRNEVAQTVAQPEEVETELRYLLAALFAPPPSQGEGFRLGRARRWVGMAALLWVLGVVAALTIPATPLAGIQTQHLPALSTTVGVVLGVPIYSASVRSRLLQGKAGPPKNSACILSQSTQDNHDRRPH